MTTPKKIARKRRAARRGPRKRDADEGVDIEPGEAPPEDPRRALTGESAEIDEAINQATHRRGQPQPPASEL